MSYKIEKDVPLPDLSVSARLKYPWNLMGPGESVFIDMDEVTKGKVNLIRSSATTWLARNRPSWRCTVRAQDGGARVWFYEPGEDDDGE